MNVEKSLTVVGIVEVALGVVVATMVEIPEQSTAGEFGRFEIYLCCTSLRGITVRREDARNKRRRIRN